MENGLRQEKSTGYIPSIVTDKGSELAPVESTVEKSVSPVLKNAPIKDESLISTEEVSVSKLLAILVMMGDFKALKGELPASRATSRNGKIYWSAELPGHDLEITGGVLLVDGISTEYLISKLAPDGTQEG